jgi:pimeloyl-ACP methyl ester carboxylesterase
VITEMLVKLLLVSGIAYVALIIFAAVISDNLIFPKFSASYEDNPDTLKLKTDKGAEITTMYLEAPGSEQLLLYSHGNGEDIGMILNFLQDFQKRGVSVLVYDYPGYGTSTHNPTEHGVYAAADAVYKFATQKLNFAPEQIVLYGYSLGSGPSCWLAERYPVNRLILDGAFTSTFRVISRIKLLPIDKFDNFSRFKNIDCSILLIHGTEDQIIPFWHAKKNWKGLHGEKQKLWVQGAGHLNIPEIAGPLYWDTVTTFIQTDT